MTHPENAMTRERALVEALRKYGDHLVDCPAHRNPLKGSVPQGGWEGPNLSVYTEDCRCGFAAALASARQESAPSADADSGLQACLDILRPAAEYASDIERDLELHGELLTRAEQILFSAKRMARTVIYNAAQRDVSPDEHLRAWNDLKQSLESYLAGHLRAPSADAKEKPPGGACTPEVTSLGP